MHLKSWAEELGLEEAIPLLAKTLEEENDQILTKVAEERVNEEAADAAAE